MSIGKICMKGRLMGIYVITGATSGIGAKTAEILRERGHEVVNIDLNGGDINANLATK